jgi:hypothetical protein
VARGKRLAEGRRKNERQGALSNGHWRARWRHRAQTSLK